MLAADDRDVNGGSEQWETNFPARPRCHMSYNIERRDVMSEITLTLPDNVAKEAEDSGLLKPAFITSLLKDELRRRKVNKLFAAMDKLAELGEPMTEEEVMAEVRAARSTRRLGR